MIRLRRAAVLLVLALAAGGLALLAVADPFHLRHARWFTAGLVLLTVLLVTAALVVAVRARPLRVLVLVLGGTAAAGWVAVVLLAARLQDDGRAVEEVRADDGRRLVVLAGVSPVAPDPLHAVVVRAGGGPFEQESLVYQGPAEGPAPSAVRFVDASTVEVEVAPGCRYRSTVEPGTLAVDPVHRPRTTTAC